MLFIRKKTRRHKNIQPPTGFEFQIPKGHTRVVVRVSQPDGYSVDKDEALLIIKSRPNIPKAAKIKYCGVTARFHVFSYPTK